ncbi:hypothetical protein [Shewanella sp. TB7-MNA-CIBAN-0143]
MFKDLPSNYSIAVNTPKPIVIEIKPSNELIAVFAAVIIVGAAWVKRR